MAEPPNVVLITTDQQRADVSAREGFPLDTTPYLDSLAENGVWFDRAYCPFPVCCPSRVSFLTGRFPSATGIRDNAIEEPPRYEADVFDVLQDRGYATALCGKNHSHLDPDDADSWFETSHWGGGPQTPRQEACDEWLDDHAAFGLETNPHPPEAQPAGRAVTAALDWLDGRGGEDGASGPFFLWLSIPEPHPPYQAPEPYYSLFPPGELPPLRADAAQIDGKGFRYEWSRHLTADRATRLAPDAEYEDLLPRLRSLYYGMCRLVDDQVERFVEGLEDRGVRDETLLVCHSDHGDYAGQYGTMRKGAGLDDALARVPLVVNGPGVVSSDGPHPAHVSLVDLLPTICEAVGAAIPAGVQGRSLWPLLRGESYSESEFESVYAEVGYGGLPYDWSDEPTPETNHRGEGASYGTCNTYTQAGTMRMVRRDDWKLVYDGQGAGRLYDLDADPAETDNRFEDPDCRDRRESLLAALLRWTLRTADDLPLPPRYTLKTADHNYRWGT